MVDKSSYKIYKWFINGFINSYKRTMSRTMKAKKNQMGSVGSNLGLWFGVARTL